MRKKVFVVTEKETEDGEIIEEYQELKLVEVIEHKPDNPFDSDPMGLGSIGRRINVMV
jgi:hypothetical protein